MPLMPRSPLSCSYEKTLKEKVIDKGKCCSCGTCGAVCPKLCGARSTNPLANGMPGTAPSIASECALCLDVCPMYNHRGERGLGKVRSMWRAKATDESILNSCQDGGACTAFLDSLKEYRCLGVGRTEWVPRPMLDRIHDTSGSKYGATASVSMLPIRNETFAFVGLPCQIQGIDLAQQNGLLREIGLKVGLFCYKNFYHAAFNDVLAREGISLRDIAKVDVKGNVVVTLSGGDDITIPISQFDGAVISGCGSCKDLSSYFSDISFGSVGTDDGYTTVLVRTGKAEELFNACMQKGYIIADKKVDEHSINRLQGKKRERNG